MLVATDPLVDAISNTLPGHLHREYTLAALDAGKSVLLEKPMGLSVEECDSMIAAAHRNDRILMVAHVLRFWPQYLAVVDLVKSGQLGKILSATASRLAPPPSWGNWFANPAWTGGSVLDLHVHDLDVFNWLFGTPRSIHARGQKGATGGWDHALTLVDYGDVSGFAEGSTIRPDGYPFTMSLWVTCEKGTVEYTFRAAGETVVAGTTSTNLMVYEAGKQPRPLPAPGDDGYEAQAAYFVECLRQQRQPERGTAQQGRLAVRMALAARQSIETNQIVWL
jgi:predicted dehydrogenase